jgi:hypothetical protein
VPPEIDTDTRPPGATVCGVAEIAAVAWLAQMNNAQERKAEFAGLPVDNNRIPWTRLICGVNSTDANVQQFCEQYHLC